MTQQWQHFSIFLQDDMLDASLFVEDNLKKNYTCKTDTILSPGGGGGEKRWGDEDLQCSIVLLISFVSRAHETPTAGD